MGSVLSPPKRKKIKAARTELLISAFLMPGIPFINAGEGSVSASDVPALSGAGDPVDAPAPEKAEVTEKQAGEIAAGFLKQQKWKDQLEPTPYKISDRGDSCRVWFKRLMVSDSGNGMVQVDKTAGTASGCPGNKFPRILKKIKLTSPDGPVWPPDARRRTSH